MSLHYKEYISVADPGGGAQGARALPPGQLLDNNSNKYFSTTISLWRNLKIHFSWQMPMPY